MSEITQEQVDQLVSKPRGEWTAADRVLLSKARKAGFKVELPEETKSESKPDATASAEGPSLEDAPKSAPAAPKPAPKAAPPKIEEAAPKKAAKPAEPEIMGTYLQTLYRIRVGTEEVSPDKINEIRIKADSLLKEVIEEMGKEDFNLEELAKKDITLRQRFERAMLIHQGLSKLEEPATPAGGFGALSRFMEEMKGKFSKGEPRKES